MKDWKGGSASVFKTLGASNHTDHERQKEDYYATEPLATQWLCKLETFNKRILEPSCGGGIFRKSSNRMVMMSPHVTLSTVAMARCRTSLASGLQNGMVI